MGAIIELLLLSVLCASVGTVQGACRHVQNDDMLEYSCVGGQLSDLDSLPASTGKLRISHMPVTVITRDMLARFGSDLWVFGCSFCGIKDIQPGAFQHLENLQQLSLENNQLTTIRASSIGSLEYLTYLDLNYNAISTIEDGVLENLPGLVDLRLSGNRLECLNLQALFKLQELSRVLLTENPEFKCPNAISAYLENRGVNLVKDPEWDKIPVDPIEVDYPDYETDYYESTTMQNTPLPPYRERLHPVSTSPPLEQPSTTSYVPPRVQTTEEVVYPPVYHTPDSRTSQTQTSPLPDNLYDAGQFYIYRDNYRPVVVTAEYLEVPTTVPSTDEVIKLVGPLPSDTPNLVQPASPSNVYQTPYYEHSVNVHVPPTVGYPMANEPSQTTTDKPLPDCVNKSSMSSAQRPLGLVILAVLTVLAGHGFVEGF